MILGLSVRHYKSYNNVNYIPITNQVVNRMSMFVGNNGVGKSSILEALDTFFNGGYWNKTKNEKQDQTFICPLFLVRRTAVEELLNLSSEDKEALDCISSFLFNLEESSNKEFKEFVRIRNAMNISREEYYLIIIGITFKDRNKAYFGSSFDNELKNKINELVPSYNTDRVLNFFRKLYTYIYIPVEAKTNDVLKLEASEMQKLMNKNILETIEKVLKEKKFSSKPKKAMTDLVTIINSTLNDFMDEINDHIQYIDPDYSYKVEDGYKKNLTASDLREHILRAYFSIRTLKKNGKEIFELSSGEQRVALIDIANAFIAKNENKKGMVLLAIDEPEASLHVSKCFSQFKRIEELSKQKNTQVLLTTHWYGAIPTLNNGTLNIIQSGSKAEISSFSLTNYLEKRRDFPDDVDLKSFFELVSTIISSIKSDNTKWLIIEGSDDALYHKRYVGHKVEDLVILPVGGCGNVIKIYEYLFAPFNEKVEKGILRNSKVLCLIDSDVSQRTTQLYSPQIENQLKICRIQNSNTEVTLNKLTVGGDYIPTEIEDCLNPTLFYNALKTTIKNEESRELSEIFDKFGQNTDAITSRVKTEQSLLKPLSLEALDYKDQLLERMSDSHFKVKLANHYFKISEADKDYTPPLFQKVIEYFNT
ncbi:AAA family ATPase [Sphingobacterium gobiense]|uniref:Endonuclease GajA/Old nuclease/RecF-like AAA domain-containing protein n=1 Tax=Sphingobacterium gobiense TaxID=1382456 RepID=A0A2S9JTU9_9SPHI|nr:AAA family ATPase [Sphingobacterium gobiense]PRD56715.1 hypothetical protein C5749_05650 [Sphingobacterium gobiense]